MGKVTARKWRPQEFQDFVGQEYITNSLQMALAQNKVGHGYLFSGCRGVGKTSAARVFSKALNCLQLTQEYEPCGICRSCKDIVEGRSTDVLEIDGASHRGIDKMRDIKDNLQFLPVYSQYKIYIIDEVHMLTNEAFNAILKILEEPPEHIVFILATTEIHKVKATIRSRCQQYYFHRLTVEQIKNQLKRILDSQNFHYEEEALTIISQSADGSMRDSQSILDQVMIYSQNSITKDKVKEILNVVSYDYFYDLFDILKNKDAVSLDRWLKVIYREGVELSFFISQLIDQFRVLILVHYDVYDDLQLEKEHLEKLNSYLPYFSVYQCHEIINHLLALYKQLRETEHEFFLFQNTMFQLLNYQSFMSMSQIIKQLQELEEKISSDCSEISIQDKSVNEIHDINKVTSSLENESEKTISELFNNFVQNIQDMKTKFIYQDVKQVVYESETQVLWLEFYSVECQEIFENFKEAEQSLLSFLNTNHQNIKTIQSWVQKAQNPNHDDIKEYLISSLDAKEIRSS